MDCGVGPECHMFRLVQLHTIPELALLYKSSRRRSNKSKVLVRIVIFCTDCLEAL